MKTLVLKISGKFVSPYDQPLVRRYANVIEQLSKEYKLAVVVGGGSIARRYIELAPESKGIKDLVGIEVSRLNALLLALHTPSAVKSVPKDPSEVLKLWDGERVLITGGLQPGQSTNAVAMVVAELIGADMVINASVVDAVYDRPPDKEGAKRIEKIRAEELMRLLSKEGWKNEPGAYELMDFTALQLLTRSEIPVAIVYGGEPERLPKIIKERAWGTLILP